MAMAASVLLEWQPLMYLEQENYQLREENRHLHFQVKELLEWKERAVRHMVKLAPLRSKAERKIRHATQLQKQLNTVEQTLQERVKLEEAAQSLQEKERLLLGSIDVMEKENTKLRSKCSELKRRQETAETHLQAVSDLFRVHLEKLVGIRESIDTAAKAHNPSENEASTHVLATDLHEMNDASAIKTRALSQSLDNKEDNSATSMIAVLTAISEKCLQWFHEHVEETFAQQQQKAALYEVQHNELEQLRQQVHAIKQDETTAYPSSTKEQQTTQKIAQLEQMNAHVQQEMTHWYTVYVEQTTHQRRLVDHMRLLLAEIRQYLRLVRVEIKKKFGYVPEAIAHNENWTRILDALDLLEKSCSLKKMVASCQTSPE